MSGSTQTTIDGREAQNTRENGLSGVNAVLWEVGADQRVPDDTETQLAEAHRRCVERGLFDGGEA